MPRPRIDAAGLGGSERMGFKGSRVRIPPSRPLNPNNLRNFERVEPPTRCPRFRPLHGTAARSERHRLVAAVRREPAPSSFRSIASAAGEVGPESARHPIRDVVPSSDSSGSRVRSGGGPTSSSTGRYPHSPRRQCRYASIHSDPSGGGSGSGRSRTGIRCRCRPAAQTATIAPSARSIRTTLTGIPRAT